MGGEEHDLDLGRPLCGGSPGERSFLRFKQFFEKTGILFNPRINAAVHFIQYTLFTSEWDSKKEIE